MSISAAVENILPLTSVIHVNPSRQQRRGIQNKTLSVNVRLTHLTVTGLLMQFDSYKEHCIKYKRPDCHLVVGLQRAMPPLVLRKIDDKKKASKAEVCGPPDRVGIKFVMLS